MKTLAAPPASCLTNARNIAHSADWKASGLQVSVSSFWGIICNTQRSERRNSCDILQCRALFYPKVPPISQIFYFSGNGRWSCASSVKATSQNSSHSEESIHLSRSWQDALGFASSLYPVYMITGAILAVTRPSAFEWFVRRSPASYSVALGTIMLSMGLTLQLRDLMDVIVKRWNAIAFGCAAQYGIMPLLGFGVSKILRLSPSLAAGLILMACCPGGTASNVVTLIAKGDVPLSVIMTSCTTLAAVVVTPLLTSLLAGAYVPVDALGLAMSTLQVVLAPVLLGAWLKSIFPQGVSYIKPFAPLAAVLISSLQASSVFSANVGLLGIGNQAASLSTFSHSEPLAQTISAADVISTNQTECLSGQLGVVVIAVLLVHAFGFLLGYVSSKLVGYKEPQSRAISIEVGMQNSSLGVVLASTHFSSPATCVPPAVSAVLMNVMGSGLAVIWQRFGGTTDENQ